MTMQDRFKFRVWSVKRKEYHKLPTYNYIGGTFNLCSYEDDIIEQSTGLKDKNDRFIYDNDLIMIGNKLYRVAIDDFGCRTVILDNNPFKEVIEWSDIVKIYYFHNRVDEIEVVGNIRENKDLLENKDE